MKNLKIRVATEAESKEAQELFFELGYYWAYKNLGKKLLLSKKDIYLFAESDGTLRTGTHQDEVFFKNWRGKEITLQELRDMVNPMKEYLEKQADGSYKLVMRGIVGKDDDIEVPEGSEVAYKGHDSGAVYFTSLEMGYRDAEVIWKRHTQPEELPFIDDGITDCREEIQEIYKPSDFGASSLNDQYAEIEQVRKHRHYFKDVSNIAEIDVYAVLKLFDVTDPCLQHIVKKALCAGKRGHKDMMEDLQNIVDTANRAVELNS